MNTIFDSYNSFYKDGNYNKLISNLLENGFNVSDEIALRHMSRNYKDTILVIAKYLEVYGIDVKFSNRAYNTRLITDTLNSGKNYMRFVVTIGDIDNMVDNMCDKYSFPQIVESDVVEFNGVFRITRDVLEKGIKSIMWDACTLYLYGIPIRREWTETVINNITNVYTMSETLSQSILYIGMCSEWLQKLICEASSFRVTMYNWCALFDGIVFDVNLQNNIGFVFMLNPRDNDTVVCISRIYLGKFFVTSNRIFNILYENRIFDNIRFTDRLVNMQIISDGSNRVVERVLNVPVYSDEEHNEILVSDIAGDSFVYNDVFVYNVGKGY